MILLYILLFILALLLVCLISNIVVEVNFGDDFSAKVKFLFFKFKFPQEKVNKPLKKQKKVTEQIEQTEKTQKKSYIKRLIEEKGLVSAVSELLSIVKSILSEFGKISKHIRIKRFNLFVCVSSDDPATTAIEYGTLCSVVFPALRYIEENTKLDRKHTKVSVNSDFETASPKFQFNAKIKLRVIFAVLFALKVLFKIIKLKMNDVKQDVKKQSINKN